MMPLICHLVAIAAAGPIELSKPEIAVAGGKVQPFISTQLLLTLPGEDDWEPLVGFRRVRAGFKGTFADGRFATGLQVSFAPSGGELIDLYGEYRAEDWILRAGQFTTPFTRYREQSHRSLLLVDWAIVAEIFGAERQIGVMLADHDGSTWTGSLGVFSGVNARASNAVALSEAFGLDLESRSDFAFGESNVPVHPEIFARVGFFTEGMDLSRTSHTDREGTHAAVFLSGAYDVRPEPLEDFAARVAPEVVFQSGPFGGTAVGYLTWFEDDGELAPAWSGLLVEGALRFTRVWEIAGRGTAVLPSDALQDATGTPALYEALGGVNAYIAGEQLKIAADAGTIISELDGDTESSPAARVQAQVAW